MNPFLLPVLVTSALTATAVPAVPALADSPSCGQLPTVVQGDPHVRSGDRGVAYLFHTGSGWGLRVTHASTQRTVVTGTLRASSGISSYRTYRLERGDAVSQSADGRLLSFRLSNVGHLDGFDVKAECSTTLQVTVRVDGTSAPTDRVYLGAHRAHPTSVPFVIGRS
jgi:hypothetical protein